MTSIFFGLFSVLSLTIFILCLIYKDKLDDGDTLPALILFSILSFIFFSISYAVFYKSNEDLYGDCMKNINKEEYCIKYLKE